MWTQLIGVGVLVVTFGLMYNWSTPQILLIGFGMNMLFVKF